MGFGLGKTPNECHILSLGMHLITHLKQRNHVNSFTPKEIVNVQLDASLPLSEKTFSQACTACQFILFPNHAERVILGEA
jgi:hypothetical protein